ncbi:ABC transporter ATP-binding protein [Brevibacillus daliensis]|uniref:ABC transporter ATP-binding protein n=1 Tax=Brevibacillus daliensis TaxID=2892995 RepID=UPI001E2D56C2|nr:ABC transporter ATP-binding protein [Brevibacillus daliensis]
MAQVVLKSLVKDYNKQNVVKGIDIVIPDGSFSVLVGPSGCGKSTTLRMIAGLEKVTKGEIWIGNQLVNDLAPGKRDLAMVFQNYALYPTMNVFDNIAFGLRNRGVSKKECKVLVEEISEIVGLTEYLTRMPSQLSGGQRQRVALARAMVKKPKVFLMDEPLSNLDAKLRNQMRVELTGLHKRLGTTFIYVTHDQVEAMTMGDQIIVMDQGTVQQAASPIQLYKEPDNQFVAQFIGSPAMNILSGFQQRLLVGFRPESAKIAGVNQEAPLSDRAQFMKRGNILSREILGSDVLYYVESGQEKLVVKDDLRYLLQEGQEVIVSVNEEDLYLFDQESGIRLRQGINLKEKQKLAGGMT